MDELVIKAQNIEEDIKEMPLLKQIEYTTHLSNEMGKVTGEEMGDMDVFCKAEERVKNLLLCLKFQYRSSKINELKQRVAKCHFCHMPADDDRALSPIVEVVFSEDFLAEIRFNWGTTITISLMQYIYDDYGDISTCDIMARWKIIPEWLKQSAKFYYGRLEKKANYDNWIDIMIDTAKELTRHKVDIITLCKRSTNFDKKGRMKKVYENWKTKGRILAFRKKDPIVHVSHAKKGEQPSWDHAPGFHGSNGTYVENANPYWCLTIKIKKPSSEVAFPREVPINIHDYVTKSLMPKLEWGRITQDRLDRLNEILKGVEMELETSDTTEAALYRNFLPIGFKSWDEYLDSILLPRL